jgi:predicted transcriptional regulator
VQAPIDLQQVTVSLPADLVEYLQREAANRKVSAADVLQQAVANDMYLRQQQLDGSTVLLEKNKKLSQIALS